MALKDLQNDLEALCKFIFEGKGEGNKAYRRLWARPSHLFTIDDHLNAAGHKFVGKKIFIIDYPVILGICQCRPQNL